MEELYADALIRDISISNIIGSKKGTLAYNFITEFGKVIEGCHIDQLDNLNISERGHGYGYDDAIFLKSKKNTVVMIIAFSRKYINSNMIYFNLNVFNAYESADVDNSIVNKWKLMRELCTLAKFTAVVKNILYYYQSILNIDKEIIDNCHCIINTDYIDIHVRDFIKDKNKRHGI